MNTLESHPNHVVAVDVNHEAAETAVKMLNRLGINMKQISIIGRDYETEERPIGFINAGDRMLSWGKLGAFWGSIWGVLFGSAMLVVPGIGYLMFAGYVVAVIEGAAIGAGFAALGGALASIGVPNDSVVRYESDIKTGNFLLMVNGNEPDLERAQKALEATAPTRIDCFTTERAVVNS